MTEINIRIDDKEVLAMLARVHARMSDMTPVMREVSGIMLDAVEENFEQEGRPKWAPLLLATLFAGRKSRFVTQGGRYRRGKRGVEERFKQRMILQKSGGLAGSVTPSSGANFARVGTNKKYAAVHQFGSKPGSGRNIPARPFLRLTDSDMAEIKDALTRYIDKGA